MLEKLSFFVNEIQRHEKILSIGVPRERSEYGTTMKVFFVASYTLSRRKYFS